MNQPPKPASAPIIWLPLLLTILPAVGSFTSGLPGLRILAEIALMFSPLLALAAGILLGIRTGKTTGSRVLLSFLWATGSYAGSLMLQIWGCAVTDYEFDIR